MSALACVLVAALLAQVPQDASRLRVIGPQPAVVVFPEPSRVTLRIELSGNDRGVARPKLPTVDGLRFDLQGPASQQRMYSDGVRMVQQTWVDWTLVITPQRVGEFVIPSFDVPVGSGQVERTQQLSMRAVKDIDGGKFGQLSVKVAPQTVYVHEPIRVTFEMAVDADLQVSQGQAGNGEQYLAIELMAPWLDELDGAVALATASVDRNRLMNLVHGQGGERKSLLRTEFQDGVRRNDRRFNVFKVERSYLPSRVGKLEIPSVVMGFDAATGETRVVQDLFGARRERVIKTFYVDAPATSVEVKPLPEAGKPNPFYGAVGRFVIDARADRDRVKVGNSVKLIVTIRGEGNTEFLKVPELGEVAGFHSLGVKEKRERGVVEVTYDLTPLQADVKALPAVRWNFFDTTPGVERYVEVSTKPVPLTVEALPPGEGLKALPGEEAKPVVPGVDDIFDMKPLAEGAAMPLQAPPSRGLLAALLALPWLIGGGLVLALRSRARARADVSGQRQRGARKAFDRARAAGKSPFEALVGYLADRLAVAEAAIIAPDLDARLRERGVEPALAQQVVAAVEAGVAARYGGGGGVDEAKARALVDALEAVRLRAPAGTAAGVVAVLLCAALAASTSAQDPAARGEAAYRAGDYAAAAKAFAEAAAQPGADRRLYYNLGNAHFREGDLGQALAAYERARLGMPRDPQLAANLALVRRKLELGSAEGEPFLQALASLRDALTPRERLALCIGLHVLAVVLLLLCWRRLVLRVLGVIVLVHALVLSVELLWLAPTRPPLGVVLAARGDVVAEPRTGLEAVAKLRRGASVEVLGEGPQWVKVRVGEREGYLPSSAVAVVR